MRKLSLPPDLADASAAREVFSKCVAGYRENNPKRQLSKYEEDVAAAAEAYASKLPHGIVEFSANHRGPAGIDDGKSLVNVYEHKFAALGSPGREYYNRIISSGGTACPICGGEPPETVDHYLPKAEFPLLAVAPMNLVPVCTRCNSPKGKGGYWGRVESDMLLHPYLDDELPDAWLTAACTFGKSLEVAFSASVPKNPVLERRCVVHLREFGLESLYASRACSHIANMKGHWRDVLSVGGKPGLRSHFESMLRSHEDNDRSSWLAALYRDFAAQSDDMADWLCGVAEKLD